MFSFITFSAQYNNGKMVPKIYSHDLLNNFFRHPYTKIDFVMQELRVTRITATKYLDGLVNLGILSKHKKGKENYYINEALFDLLLNAGAKPSIEQ